MSRKISYKCRIYPENDFENRWVLSSWQNVDNFADSNPSKDVANVSVCSDIKAFLAKMTSVFIVTCECLLSSILNYRFPALLSLAIYSQQPFPFNDLGANPWKLCWSGIFLEGGCWS